MTDPRYKPAVDYETLGAYLKVLSLPTRLELVRKLQTPRAVSEIDVSPTREARDANPDRSIARQTVESHLERLKEAGLVQTRAGTRGGRAVTEWIANQARLFVIADEMRRLSLVRALPGHATADVDDAAPRPPQIPAGRALLAVNGPLEGAAFPLDGAGPWVVGREKGLPVSLPYDPFVSKENTRLHVHDGVLHAIDLPGAKNGTRVNWRPLRAGESAPLTPGDTLGVGRTLLVVRGA